MNRNQKGAKSKRSRSGLRRGFAVVLTAALLVSNMVFAPVSAEAAAEGMSQHYIFRPAATVAENDAQLGSNILIGANVDATAVRAKFVHTDGYLAGEDGTQRIATYHLTGAPGTAGNGSKTDPADHYGLPYRLIYKQTDDGTNVDPGEDNASGDTESGDLDQSAEATKAPKEMLEVYVNGMDDLDTTGLAAVNVSLLYGFFAPHHNAAEQSNQNNVALEKVMQVFVSVDGETWLPGSVGIRSSRLVGGGLQSAKDGWPAVFYRIETEDLLSIPGVAGSTIKNIKIMPYGESLRTFGRFGVSELAVNTYDTEYAFDKLVPADELTYTNVGGDTLRQIAVEEALRTATTKWTTDQFILNKFSGKSCTYWPTLAWDLNTSIVHSGPTYSQSLDSTRELFQSQIDEDGNWMGGYGNVDDPNGIYGMDCQTFVFNAVSRVSRSYAWSCANTVNASSTSIVGDHLDVREHPLHTDKDILDRSSEQAIYESYSQADAGDITDSYGYGLGHIRLVKSSHTVYIPAEGGYFNQVSAPEYAPVAEGQGEYLLLEGVVEQSGGGYAKKDVYVYVGAGNGDYNNFTFVEAGDEQGCYNGGYAWVGEGKGKFNKVYGYFQVGEGSGSYVKTEKYVWVGEGEGEYALDEGVYYRAPRVNGQRRGDYTRTKEGVYTWAGEGKGSFNIDPDQSSVVCVHQASIPKYFFKHPETGDIRSVFVYKMSSDPESAYYVSWENSSTGVRSEIVDPPMVVEGYELMYSCSSRENDEFSFTKLKNTGYVAFTVDEYETGKVENVDVQAVLGSAAIGQNFVDSGAVLSVSSNYRLISYQIDLLDGQGKLLLDENGNAVYSTGLQYVMESNIFTQTLNSSALNAALANLSDGKYQIRLSVDSGPFTRLGQDTVPCTVKTFDFEVEGRVHAQLSEGDVVYIPSACKANQTVQAYVVNSVGGAYSVGDAIMVTMPDNSEINGTDGATRAQFWQMIDGTLTRVKGNWGATPTKFKFGYHDVITSFNGSTLDIADASGHTGNSESCSYYFTHSCGWDGESSNYNAYECADKLSIAEDLKIVDLRTDVLVGKVGTVSTLSEVKSLTDAGQAVINLYVPDGALKSAYANYKVNNRAQDRCTGTASVILVIDPGRYFTADYPVTVEQPANGTIQLNRTSGAAGDLVTVTAAPAEGCALETVLVDGTPIVGDTFPIRGLHTVTARFVQYDNLVTLVQAPGGTVAVDKRGGSDGDTITVTATPYEDYVLKSIQVNGEDIDGNTFTLSGNATVTAVFAKVVRPGDVMYFPGDPVGKEYVEGYLVSSDTPNRKIFFYFEGGFTGK